MAKLVLRSVLKAFMGVDQSDTSQDVALDVHNDQCSARVESWCNRIFTADDYTEFYQGTGSSFLPLRQRPINSVTSVYVDTMAYWGQATDAFAAATLLTAGTGYAIVKDGASGVAKSGMLYRINSVWPKPEAYQAGVISAVPAEAIGNIKVTYNAGFTTIPHDIQQAVCMLIAATKRIAKFGVPTSNESWEDYSIAIGNAAGDAIGGLPPDTLAALAKYRNLAIG